MALTHAEYREKRATLLAYYLHPISHRDFHRPPTLRAALQLKEQLKKEWRIKIEALDAVYFAQLDEKGNVKQ